MSEVQQTGKQSKFRFTYIVTAVAVSCLMVGASLGMIIDASTPGFPTVIEPGSMASSASYVVFKDGSTTYAKNGTTGALAFSSTSSYSVLQSCINDIANKSGGSIDVKMATYTLAQGLNITHSNIAIDADIGTTLTGTVKPLLTIWANNWNDYDVDLILHNIQISNLNIYYTGSNSSGTVVMAHSVKTDDIAAGVFIFHNLRIRSASSIADTNKWFIGLELWDIIGGSFDYISVVGFGTGVLIKTGWTDLYQIPSDSQSNYYDHFTVSYCLRDVWLLGLANASWLCHDYNSIWEHGKFMYSTDHGFYGRVADISFRDCAFESFDNPVGAVCAMIELNSSGISMYACSFVGSHQYGIFSHSGQYLLERCTFSSIPTAIKADGYGIYTLIENSFVTVTTKIDTDYSQGVRTINDAVACENVGYLDCTGSTNTFQVTGLTIFYFPYVVLLTCNNSAAGNVYVTARTGTTFDVYIENQPGANIFRIYWVVYDYTDPLI